MKTTLRITFYLDYLGQQSTVSLEETETREKRLLFIQYPEWQSKRKKLAFIDRSNLDTASLQSRNQVVFEVEGDLDAFVKKFNDTFLCDRYARISHNCSDATKFVLDYFVGSPSTPVKLFIHTSKITQTLCCLSFAATCPTLLSLNPGCASFTFLKIFSGVVSTGTGIGITALLKGLCGFPGMNTPLNVHAQACCVDTAFWKLPHDKTDSTDAEHTSESDEKKPFLTGPTPQTMN